MVYSYCLRVQSSFWLVKHPLYLALIVFSSLEHSSLRLRLYELESITILHLICQVIVYCQKGSQACIPCVSELPLISMG